MLIEKKDINKLNRNYIHFIKRLYENSSFSKEEHFITQACFCNKKIEITLIFDKDTKLEHAFSIGGFYFPVQNKRKYKILIDVTINDTFNKSYFEQVNMRIKANLVHEFEHHLQKCKIPFREKLKVVNYITDVEGYINNPSELEALTKHIYFLHRKTKIPFLEILQIESENISSDINMQKNYVKNIIGYVLKRKDLNLLTNIQL
jgi:hypothetical protein